MFTLMIGKSFIENRKLSLQGLLIGRLGHKLSREYPHYSFLLQYIDFYKLELEKEGHRFSSSKGNRKANDKKVAIERKECSFERSGY